jgi:hypothetical protein
LWEISRQSNYPIDTYNTSAGACHKEIEQITSETPSLHHLTGAKTFKLDDNTNTTHHMNFVLAGSCFYAVKQVRM